MAAEHPEPDRRQHRSPDGRPPEHARIGRDDRRDRRHPWSMDHDPADARPGRGAPHRLGLSLERAGVRGPSGQDQEPRRRRGRRRRARLGPGRRSSASSTRICCGGEVSNADPARHRNRRVGRAPRSGARGARDGPVLDRPDRGVPAASRTRGVRARCGATGSSTTMAAC